MGRFQFTFGLVLRCVLQNDRPLFEKQGGIILFILRHVNIFLELDGDVGQHASSPAFSVMLVRRRRKMRSGCGMGLSNTLNFPLDADSKGIIYMSVIRERILSYFLERGSPIVVSCIGRMSEGSDSGGDRLRLIETLRPATNRPPLCQPEKSRLSSPCLQ